MGLSVSDKLAFIREYKRQGGKGNYLSAIKQYADGGEVTPTQGIPYQAPTNQQVWQGTIPQQQAPYTTPGLTRYNKNTDTYEYPHNLEGPTITPKPKTGLLNEWGRNIALESKDAGLMNAMIGVPINAAVSLPQMAATKLFSGEAQRPSEALGVENKYGKVATDIVLDPLNLLGIGLLNKEKHLKNAYRLNPWAFKPNPEAFYHRTPNINNIIQDGKLVGFGNSEAGKIYSNLAGPGGRGNVVGNTKINLQKSAHSEPYFSKGTPLDFGRTTSTIEQGYPGPYIAEAVNTPFIAKVNGKLSKVVDPVTKEIKIGVTPNRLGAYAVPEKGFVPLNNVKFYKEHWLKGYKQIKDI